MNSINLREEDYIMRKVKIISMATTALLAVAPVITSPVLAADNANNIQLSSNGQTTTSISTVSAEYIYKNKKERLDPNNQTFQIAPNSKFDPTAIKLTNGGVVNLSGSQGSKVEIESNPVDTTKAGATFVVKLSVTDSAGNKSTISYQVFVKPQGLFQLNFNDRDYMRGLGDTDIFYQGEKYYVGNNLEFEDGKFYTGISRISQKAADGNTAAVRWIQTKYLAESESAKPELVKKTIMHKARAYTWGGTKTRKVYSAYTNVYVKNKIIHVDGGKYWTSGDFYQVYNADDTYTNYLIKVGNIDGTKRMLKHNAYIYASSTRRANRTVLKKGTTITTYGDSYKFKNGKHYYRIEGATKTDKRYVKVENFK